MTFTDPTSLHPCPTFAQSPHTPSCSLPSLCLHPPTLPSCPHSPCSPMLLPTGGHRLDLHSAPVLLSSCPLLPDLPRVPPSKPTSLAGPTAATPSSSIPREHPGVQEHEPGFPSGAWSGPARSHLPPFSSPNPSFWGQPLLPPPMHTHVYTHTCTHTHATYLGQGNLLETQKTHPQQGSIQEGTPRPQTTLRTPAQFPAASPVPHT